MFISFEYSFETFDTFEDEDSASAGLCFDVDEEDSGGEVGDSSHDSENNQMWFYFDDVMELADEEGSY